MVKWQGELNDVKKKPNIDYNKNLDLAEGAMSPVAAFVLGVVSFFGSMTFWSQNITGNAVLEFNRSSANWLGGLLFVLSMIWFLFYVQKRKN